MNIKVILVITGVAMVSVLLCYATLYTQSIRLDEAQSLWMATKSFEGIIAWVSQDVHVPLYGVILHLWVQIWGADIVKARMLSTVFFVLTLPFLYLTARESTSEKVALLAVVLFAFSPFIVWYTSEARMYTMFAFITCVNHWFFIKMWHSQGRKGKLGYYVSAIVGFYTHYFFAFLVASQVVYGAAWLFFHRQLMEKKKDEFLARRSVVINHFLLAVSAFVWLIPWIYVVLKTGLAASASPEIPPPTSFNIFETLINFVFGFQNQPIQSLFVSLWPIVVAALFFVFTQRRRSHLKDAGYFMLVSFLPMSMAFTVSFVKPVFLSRYLILSTPTLFIIIAWMLSSYSKRFSRVISAFFILVLLGLGIYQNVSENTPVKEDYSGVVAYLNKTATVNDKIVVTAPFTIYPVEYMYQGTNQIDTIPYWNRYLGGMPAYSYGNMVSQIKNYATTYRNLYVVFSYDQGYQSSVKNYLDTHYHRLSDIKFSPQIELAVYKLRYDQPILSYATGK